MHHVIIRRVRFKLYGLEIIPNQLLGIFQLFVVITISYFLDVGIWSRIFKCSEIP